MSNFERKAYSREEINIMIAEQLSIGIEPICKEIGKALEGLQKRIVDLETATNSIIKELKDDKEKNSRTIQ